MRGQRSEVSNSWTGILCPITDSECAVGDPERYAQVRCHSECSEESLSFFAVSHLEQKKEILHFVQNDSYLHRCA